MTDLLRLARDYTKKGATVEVAFADGFTLGPAPIFSLYLDESRYIFAWAGDDKAHAGDIADIGEGDDGEIHILDVDGRTITVWGAWSEDDLTKLANYAKAVKAGAESSVPIAGGVDYGDV